MIIFRMIADWIVYILLKMDKTADLTVSLHFFIEDILKIYFLLVIMIFIISFFRAGMDVGRIRSFLSGRNRFFGYFAAALFGTVTPFCSCSGIPLFLGFTSAGIPLGITMSFLITSPMVNEAAVVMLGSSLGIQLMILYVLIGILAGVLGGFLMDSIGAEKYLKIKPVDCKIDSEQKKRRMTIQDRFKFSKNEVIDIFSGIWIWILAGVGIGALLHGFVPENFISRTFSDGQWWTVPAAVLTGIPLYANAGGIIPVIDALIQKGLSEGTALALMMSVVGASFPELMMLKEIMKTKLLVLFVLMMLCFFTLAGWGLNLIFN